MALTGGSVHSMLTMCAISGSMELVTGAESKKLRPRIKWAQDQSKIFISLIVKDLDPDSVSLDLDEHAELLKFSARTKLEGDEYAMDLELIDPLRGGEMHWDVGKRPDRFGTVVQVTLTKVYGHRWDLLLRNQNKFKHLIEKDWTREDSKLEPNEDLESLTKSGWLGINNESHLVELRKEYPVVVVAPRHYWCTSCKKNDEKLSKLVKRVKKKVKKNSKSKWKRIVFAEVDSRKLPKLARELGVECSSNDCGIMVFSGDFDDEANRIPKDGKLFDEEEQGQSYEDFLEKHLETCLFPALKVFKSRDGLEKEKEKARRGNLVIAYFESKSSPNFKEFSNAANMMRDGGHTSFVAVLGEPSDSDHWELYRSDVYNAQGTEPVKYPLSWAGDPIREAPLPARQSSKFAEWMRYVFRPWVTEYDISTKSVLSQDDYAIPAAIFYYDAKENHARSHQIGKSTMEKLAKKYMGRILFYTAERQHNGYELEAFALTQPEEEYPSFGITANLSTPTRHFGFRPSEWQELGNDDFWRDGPLAVKTLSKFIDKVLSGKAKEDHENGPHHAAAPGEVKRWTYWELDEFTQPKDTHMLVEVMSSMKRGNEKKERQMLEFAKYLEPLEDHIRVGRYDIAKNWLSPKVASQTTDPLVGFSEWLWFSKTGIKTKLKVSEAKELEDKISLKDVVKFVKKQAELESISEGKTWHEQIEEASVVVSKVEEAMSDFVEPVEEPYVLRPEDDPMQNPEAFGWATEADRPKKEDTIPGAVYPSHPSTVTSGRTEL
eukprot:TRINITY_DN8995_c3_g1_i1.p1 TRINITY_DN8995_c3_g1~~TRINITY_DN8995_c3_g1_i1.p1  ORF type:complete len:795 (+),score=120.28 TRINITY_DN8995_c3_g1_i1:64-2385(+)